MPKRIRLGVCGLGLLGAALAHAAAFAPERQASAPTTEEQIRSLEREWVDAEVRQDAAALHRILDARFIATLGAGSPMDREAFIHAIVSGSATGVSRTLSESSIITDGDTAVVAALDSVRGVMNGAPFTHAYRYTATYIRRGGRWVALAEHLVGTPAAK